MSTAIACVEQGIPSLVLRDRVLPLDTASGVTLWGRNQDECVFVSHEKKKPMLTQENAAGHKQIIPGKELEIIEVDCGEHIPIGIIIAGQTLPQLVKLVVFSRPVSEDGWQLTYWERAESSIMECATAG